MGPLHHHRAPAAVTTEQGAARHPPHPRVPLLQNVCRWEQHLYPGVPRRAPRYLLEWGESRFWGARAPTCLAPGCTQHLPPCWVLPAGETPAPRGRSCCTSLLTPFCLFLPQNNARRIHRDSDTPPILRCHPGLACWLCALLGPVPLLPSRRDNSALGPPAVPQICSYCPARWGWPSTSPSSASVHPPVGGLG